MKITSHSSTLAYDEVDSIKSKELIDLTKKIHLHFWLNVEMIFFGKGIIFLGQGVYKGPQKMWCISFTRMWSFIWYKLTTISTQFILHYVDWLLMWVMTNKYMNVILQVVASFKACVCCWRRIAFNFQLVLVFRNSMFTI